MIDSRLFISYSSQDRRFVVRLAKNLQTQGFNVWYDGWEIAVGDSIVQKIFAGIQASDTLIVVLSSASVKSRWVQEELNTAVMRRISENDIRILPVLRESCEVPASLRQIRYADFRRGQRNPMAQLIESLAPEKQIWQALAERYDEFYELGKKVISTDLNDPQLGNMILALNSLLESALNLWTKVELRKSGERMRDMNFFEKIRWLANRGVDARSQTWNAVVRLQADYSHSRVFLPGSFRSFVEVLNQRYGMADTRESLQRGVSRLHEVMRLLCSKPSGRKSLT